MSSYLVVTTKSWNIENFSKIELEVPGDWHLITDKNDLNIQRIEELKPDYIFFPHWSWIVPEEIVNNYTCVCFHMTDLPFGRGGSPLQNLIVRGYKETMLSVLKMNDKLDEGPIYFKEPLSLEGSAEEILRRASNISFLSMKKMIQNRPTPQKQTGEAEYFQRRKANDNKIPFNQEIDTIYDYIRMLDAEGYPKAFYEIGDFQLEFSNAKMNGKELEAKIVIKKRGK